MKRFFISGASGFVGTFLVNAFLKDGHTVVGVGRSKQHPSILESNRFKWISADTTLEGSWQEHVGKADVIVNLAGRTIFKIWTQAYKHAIYDSRVLTTRNIVDAMVKPNTVFLTTSAVGIYGDGADIKLTEESRYGNEFLSRVCVDWETEGLMARDKGIRVCIMRFGVVLGQQGALAKMVPAFKLFLGGPLGKGNQWFPWIHIQDIQAGIQFLIDQKELEGVFNFTAPEPVQQKTFANSLGSVLSRPAFLPAPSFMVKTIMGELGSVFLESQRAVPIRLVQSGYSFLFKSVDTALNDILGK